MGFFMTIRANSLKMIEQSSEPILQDKQLQKIGEDHSNVFLKIFKRLFLAKPDFENYFVNRGIKLIKQHNLEFVKDRFQASSKELQEIQTLIPERMFLSDRNIMQIKHLENYFSLRNKVFKQRQEEPSKKHWMDAFTSQISMADDSAKLDKIKRLNQLFIENENWLTHDDFAKHLEKMGPFDQLDSAKITQLENLLRLVVSEQTHKKALVEAFFQVEDRSNLVKFYSDNRNLLKEVPLFESPELAPLLKAFSQLGDKLPVVHNFYKKDPNLLKELAAQRSPDLAKQMINLYEWNEALTTKETPSSQTKAFIDVLGVKHLADSNPADKAEKANNIKTLFSFYSDVIAKEKSQANILAKALDLFIPVNQLNQAVKSIGMGFLNPSIIRNKAEKRVLELYADLASQALEEAKVKAPNPPLSIEDTLKNNPFSIGQKLLPTFLGKIVNDSEVERKLDQALEAIAPFANELILSEDVKAFLNKKEGKINDKFLPIKLILVSTSKENFALALSLGKTIAKSTLKGELGKFVANFLVEANALHFKRDTLATKDQKKFDQKLSPLQLWLLTGLPQLASKTPFINTLTSAGTSILNTSFGQWVAGGIGSKVLRGFLSDLIDEAPLSDERKAYWKNNQELMNGIDSLVKILVPVIPKIKEKLNLDYYTEAVKKINGHVQSPTPVDLEKVQATLLEVVNHFLDEDLIHFEEPLLATVGKVKDIG